MTDAGTVYLSGLARLRWLNLFGTAVSDAGLAPLKKLTRLEELDVMQTRVTDAGVTGFKKTLPIVTFYRGQEGIILQSSSPVQRTLNRDGSQKHDIPKPQQ